MATMVSADRILSLTAAGKSQRAIAAELGCTQYRVRCVQRAETTRQVIRRPKGKVRLHSVSSRPSTARRALVLSDIHIPYHDHAALAVALAYAKDYQPHVLVLNGDIVDCHNISSHQRQRHEVVTFEDELAEARQFLRVLRRQHKDARILYTAGNHEMRLERYLANHAPDLSSMPQLALDELLDLASVGVEWLDETQKVNLGELEVFHGSIIRKDGGNSARAHMLRRGGSVLMGHTHRLACVMRTDRHGTHVAVENGHLASPTPDWLVDPDWQQGFTQVDYLESGKFWITLHPIHQGELVVGGRRYAARS